MRQAYCSACRYASPSPTDECARCVLLKTRMEAQSFREPKFLNCIRCDGYFIKLGYNRNGKYCPNCKDR